MRKRHLNRNKIEPESIHLGTGNCNDLGTPKKIARWVRLRCAVLATASCLMFVISASAQTGKNEPKKPMEINAITKMTGGEVRGPKKIRLTHVNTLRYDVGINRAVTYLPGLSLSEIGGFLPKSPAAPAGSAQRATTTAIAAAETDAFNRLVDRYDTLASNWSELQQHIGQQIDKANEVRDLIERFIRRTDTMLAQNNGPKSVIDEIKRLQPTISEVTTAQYGVKPAMNGRPELSIFALIADLDVLRAAVLRFKVDNPTWSIVPANAAILTDLDGKIVEFKNAVKAIDRNSEQGKAYLRQQVWLKSWQQQMTTTETTGEKSFELAEFEVGCAFAFSREKRTKVELLMRDRLSDATTGTPQEIITVVCSAPVSLSGGFGFSAIDEKDFIFVQSTKTTTDSMGKPVQSVINRFGLKNESSFRTLPVLLVNTRVWEPNDVFSLHASAGAGVDVKTGQAGTDIEYIAGPSFSFWRSIFVTPGIHVGRVPSLAGGFKLDDEVPTGVSQPPITKTWAKGFAVTFTYFIR